MILIEIVRFKNINFRLNFWCEFQSNLRMIWKGWYDDLLKEYREKAFIKSMLHRRAVGPKLFENLQVEISVFVYTLLI